MKNSVLIMILAVCSVVQAAMLPQGTTAGSISTALKPQKIVYLFPTDDIEAYCADDTHIILSAGTWEITDDINVSFDNFTLEGQGPQTIINNATGEGYCCIYQAGANHDITIKNLLIDNNHAGDPFDAFNKCIFINGNVTDPALCHNIVIDGVTAMNSEAETICIDYSYYVTVRNCTTYDGAWAGITLAQCKYGNIYNNRIVRSGHYNNGNTLSHGINLQSSPYCTVHDNWIHNGLTGGIGVSTAFDAYDSSHHVSIYGNTLIGCTSNGVANGAAILIASADTLVPEYINIHDNHVYSTYLSSCTFDFTGNADGELNLTAAGTKPFVDIEVGDNIYLTANGGVAAGQYVVAGVDSGDYQWVNLTAAAGLTGDGTTTFLHGYPHYALEVLDGTEIKIYNNNFDAQYSAGAISTDSTLTAGSLVYAWDNIFGPNYIFWTRPGTSVDFKGRPGSVPVARTTATTVDRYPRGTTFTNTGATGSTTHTLPSAVPGDIYRFAIGAAQPMIVDPAGTETLEKAVGSGALGAGEYITSSTVGDWIELTCFVAGTWRCTGASQAWTEESP